MLPPEILSALKAYVLSRETLPSGAEDPLAQQNQPFSQGQTVQGTVLAETSQGVFTVRVAQQLVQLNLPETIRAGDIVQLQVLSLQPRLTFGLSTFENPASTTQQLSDAARLLSALTPETATKALIQQPGELPLMTPAQGLPQPGVLAGTLRQAIQGSGLFYESHQAQWVAGARTTAELMAEPQNQPPASAAQTSASPAQPMTAAGPPQSAPSLAAASQAVAHAGADAGNAAQNLPLARHIQTLVQQQLQALETGRILWQGPVFPGQTMEWEIWRQRGQGGGGGAEEQQAQWATSLTLVLPRLGPVNVQLRWLPAGIQLGLNAASADTRALMSRAQPQLLAALASAGVSVSGATVGATAHVHS